MNADEKAALLHDYKRNEESLWVKRARPLERPLWLGTLEIQAGAKLICYRRCREIAGKDNAAELPLVSFFTSQSQAITVMGDGSVEWSSLDEPKVSELLRHPYR